MCCISRKVANIIQAELDQKGSALNWHGVSLDRCLLDPVLRQFEDSFNDGEVLKMWLVLEENPETLDGYKIVYDPEENEFGLALSGKGALPVFIGYYGSFVDTLEGM